MGFFKYTLAMALAMLLQLIHEGFFGLVWPNLSQGHWSCTSPINCGHCSSKYC